MTPNLALRLLLQCVRSDLLEHFLPASQKIFLWYVEKIPNLSLALSIQDFEYCIKELQDQTIQERKSGREQFFNFCVRQLSDDSFFPASSSPAASSPVLAQGSPSSAAPLSDQLSALAAVASEVSNTARAPVPAPSVAPAVSRSVSSASTPLAMQLISPTSTVVTAGVRPSFAADSISTQGDGGNKKEKGSDQDVELVENKQRDARGDDEEEDKEEGYLSFAPCGNSNFFLCVQLSNSRGVSQTQIFGCVSHFRDYCVLCDVAGDGLPNTTNTMV